MITTNLILKIKTTANYVLHQKKRIHISSTGVISEFFVQIRSEYIQILFIYSKKKEIKKVENFFFETFETKNTV